MLAEYLNQPVLGGEGCLVFQRVILGQKCWYYTIGITQLDCIPFAETTLTFADLGHRARWSSIFDRNLFFHDYYFLFILFHNFHKEVTVTFTHRITIQREPVDFAAVSNHRHMFFFSQVLRQKLQAQGTDHQVKGKLQSFGGLQAPKPRLTKLFFLVS